MATVRVSTNHASATIRNKKIRAEVMKRVDKVLSTHVRMRQRATQTWSDHNTPDFKKHITVGRGWIRWAIEADAPNAEAASISVYRLINDGTDVRRAKMTPDFKRKTSPGSLTSRPGRGRVQEISPNFDFPGIEARRFDEQINEILEPRLVEAIREGYKVGFGKV